MIVLATAFGIADWAVLAAYFALLVGTGIWLSRRQKGTEDYFLASRSMPAWAVSISVLATSLSAATFIAVPQQGFTGNLTYLSASLGTLIAAAVVAVVFIPAFYRHGVTTVYELLEKRFGTPAKLAGSWTFLIGRIFASGARVYIAAHALSFVAFGDLATNHLLISIGALALAGVLYTVAGGIATVIWTDAVQTVVFLGAMLAAVIVLVSSIPAPASEIVNALSSAGKLTLIDTSFDPTVSFTLWTALTGFALLNLAALGTDQDLAQRLLTCRSAWKAGWSVVWSQLIGLPVVLLFLTMGLLLWVYHQQPDLMGAAWPGPAPEDSRKAFLAYLTGGLPPGLSGLMIAGLFAAGLSSLDSTLNAMSSAFVNDCYRRMRPGRDERHYLRTARIGVVVAGVLLASFAAFCVFWQQSSEDTLLEFALRVMVFAYAGLVAVFLCALLTRRGTTGSVISALGVGFAATLATEPVVLTRLGWPQEHIPAFPWRLVFAALLAFIVACLPRGRGARA